METAQLKEIDIHVGKQLRKLRTSKGETQTQLGTVLGNVTFQQIQKYERGQNRLSCGRLFAICEHYAVSPAYFFEGLLTSMDPTPMRERLKSEIDRAPLSKVEAISTLLQHQ